MTQDKIWNKTSTKLSSSIFSTFNFVEEGEWSLLDARTHTHAHTSVDKLRWMAEVCVVWGQDRDLNSHLFSSQKKIVSFIFEIAYRIYSIYIVNQISCTVLAVH